jgi:hydrogenase expression/formation protein HypC
VEIQNDELRLALVEVGGDRRSVSLAMLADEEVEAGNWLLVHMGFALARIDEQEARRIVDSRIEMSSELAGRS